jgi:hypothetical protein
MSPRRSCTKNHPQRQKKLKRRDKEIESPRWSSTPSNRQMRRSLLPVLAEFLLSAQYFDLKRLWLSAGEAWDGSTESSERRRVQRRADCEQGRSRYVACVGLGSKLRGRVEQHLTRRDCSVTTGVSAVSLNPDKVPEVHWWNISILKSRMSLKPLPSMCWNRPCEVA